MWNDEKDGWEEDGNFIPAYHGFAWYVAPTQIGPSQLDFRPQDLALTLNSAKLGHGRVMGRAACMPSLRHFLGTPDAPPENLRHGQTRDAEDLLESVRQQVQPKAPSRLECYFVSLSAEAAHLRLDELRGERAIFPCRVLQDGHVFSADIRLFQRVCDTQRQEDAERYWAGADFQTIATSNVECMVGGSLYFPDWETLPELDVEKIIQYQSIRELCRKNNLSLQGWFGPDGLIP